MRTQCRQWSVQDRRHLAGDADGTAAAPTWCDGQQHAGFTLIEMVVVLAILGFALALIASSGPFGSRGLDLRGSAASLAAGLRQTRSEAILRNQPVAFTVDLAAHRFRAGRAPVRQLPPQLAIELLTTDGQQRKGAAGDIRFNPDGSSTGGRISLADNARRIMIGVDWLTGRVSVADAAR